MKELFMSENESVNSSPFIRAHFSERRLRPLTLLESDEDKVKRFHEMLKEFLPTHE